MADVVGRGVIELVADARKLKAGIEDAKKSLRTLGDGQKDISKSAQQSIDNYIGRLNAQNAVVGKSVRETELYKLALRGASNEQLNAANAALKFREAQAGVATSINAVRSAFVLLGTVAVTGLIAAAAAFDHLVKRAGDFQDMAEKTGDTAANIASLAVAAAVGGTSMEGMVAASVKLTKALTGVDDDSKAAGAAIEALGLNLAAFKQLAPADQFETIAKALDGFEEGAGKTAVAVALFGKAGAEMLPFLKELAKEGGRQTILTQEQIDLADEYSDKQKKLRTEMGLYAAVIATEMLPSYNDLSGAFVDVLKGIAGVEDGAKGLKNNTAIQDFADSVARGFAFVVDAADGAVRAFQLVGKSIAALGAIQSSVLNADIRGALSIANAVSEDIRNILNRPFLGSALDARIAARQTAGGRETGNQTPPKDKPTLRFGGAVKKSSGSGTSPADTAAQEAKAQLAFDLEQIRKASDATINAFANAEKIMQAMRSAGLVNDQKYFAEKLGFIKANSAEQEAELQKEIARLQQEVFVGKNAAKERIDNDRKIADAQARIARIRADATADIQVNSIQETAANLKVAQSYVDAKVAANAYIESIVRRNKTEIEGIGRGTQFREIQSGRSQIEDKFSGQRQTLERDLRNQQITKAQFDTYLRTAQDTYSKEIILYDERTETLLQKQGDWVNGATEALRNYYDESRNIAKQTEELFTNAFKSAEDALVQFTKTGKLDFKSLVDSITADIARMAIKQNITGPLSKWLEGAIGGGTQAPAPVETRSIAAAISGGTGAASEAASGAAFSAAVSAAGIAFTTEVSAGGLTVGTELSTAGLLLSTEIGTAGTFFAAEVAAAGAAFAATVAASSVASGAASILGSFASGVDYIPKTGLYRLHKGESVVSAAANNGSAGRSVTLNMPVTFTGQQNSQSVSQGLVKAGRQLQRELARNTA